MVLNESMPQASSQRTTLALCMLILYYPAMIIKRFAKRTNSACRIRLGVVLFFVTLLTLILANVISNIIHRHPDTNCKLQKVPDDVEKHYHADDLLDEKPMDFPDAEEDEDEEEEELDENEGDKVDPFYVV